ncbi:unnamed protein product [Durusdinium trenchii]|uniref:Uncharacterized protein n=1 Tax=Durusdinium trenchii TaxID=1381693 RepID=A0ABP0NKM6_9DINO
MPGWVVRATFLCWSLLERAAGFRSNAEKDCVMKEALRISWRDQATKDTGGEFDFLHSAAWNGVKLATKEYGEGCRVDYSVVCSGTSASLKLQDSCGARTDTRSLWSSRSSELHTGGSSFGSSLAHPFRKANDRVLEVFLPKGTKKHSENSVRMTEDGSSVTFRFVKPPTLKEQLAEVGKMIFFTNVPKLAMCLPQHEDYIFHSNLTGCSSPSDFGSSPRHASDDSLVAWDGGLVVDFVPYGCYSAQQCAACHNFLEGKLKGLEPCAVAETSQSRARCELLMNEMQEEKADGERIVDTISKSWRSRSDDLTMPLAWQLGCQDLGCCPLDPEAAKVMSDEAKRSLALEKFQDERKSERVGELTGVADAILNDPDARFKLESVLKMKVRHKKDEVQVLNEDLLNDISQIKVPKSNKDCRWNFKKARCEPKPGCDYKYRFGDRSLHKSCRLSAQKQPTSDAECLWNYKKARCHQPLYCARRCKPGKDWTLDQCCKLRTKEVTAAKVKEPKGDFTLTDEEMEEIDSAVDEVLADLVAEEGATEGSESIGLESDESDESSVGLESDESDESSAPPAGEGASAGEGEVEGNCQSPSDRTLMKRPNLSQDLEDASRASLGAAFGFPPVYLKRDKVLKKFVELGMSEMCTWAALW